MTKATVKETLVAALQASGFDTITACEHATAMVRELNDKPPGTYTIRAGVKFITIRRDSVDSSPR